MNNQQYHDNEMKLLRKELQAVEDASLTDRRVARDDFSDDLIHCPEIVANRISWLLNGSYGYGRYEAAKEIIRRPRMNREAALTVMIAALEWKCPRLFTVQAWKKLNAKQKKALSEAIAKEIEHAENELKDQKFAKEVNKPYKRG